MLRKGTIIFEEEVHMINYRTIQIMWNGIEFEYRVSGLREDRHGKIQWLRISKKFFEELRGRYVSKG